MKHYSITLAFILFVSMGSLAQESIQEQKEQKKQERYQQIKNLVESGQYEFRAQKANPQKGSQIDLTTLDNYLRINTPNASASMPYIGRAFSGVAYPSGDGGINFDGPMKNYTIKLNDKKRRITISFSTKGKSDNFKCQLTITSLDNASLSVSSNKRQGISYMGGISALAEEK